LDLSTEINNLKVTDYKTYDANSVTFGISFKLNNAFKDVKGAKNDSNNLDRFKKDI